jgi:hypothetical protein
MDLMPLPCSHNTEISGGRRPVSCISLFYGPCRSSSHVFKPHAAT